MNYLKANFDRVLLIGAGLLLALVSVYAVLGRGAQQLEFPLPAPTGALAPFEKSPEIAQLAAEEAKLSEPSASAWIAPDDGGSLFVSRIYLLGEAGLVDLYDSDLQLYDGIPNEWLLKHGLDYTDKQLATSDPDNDGFTNLEEFRAGTDPMDPASRPAAWSKLRLVSSKIDKLRTKFESLPRGDLDVVQINTVSAENPRALTGASQFYRLKDFIKLSETSPDGKQTETPTPLQFVGSKFITRFNPNTSAEEKIPQITLLNSADGVKIELLQGEVKDSPYSLATLQDTRSGGQTLVLRSGEEFTLDEGKRYKLIDVSVEAATIKDLSSGETHPIPGPRPMPSQRLHQSRLPRAARVGLGVALCFLAEAHLAFSGVGSDGAGTSSYGGVEAQAELEIAKRMQLADDYAPQAMQRGSVALMERDYETAYAQYKAAVDALPDAPNVRELRTTAMDGFSKAVMGLAEFRIEEGRWEDAEETVRVLLQPQYNPNYKPAQRLLARLESPDYFNKTVTPGFVAKVEEVKTLLNEGQGLYDSGRFDEAVSKYEAVLRLDRYNVAARRGMEQVNLARSRVADAAYNDTRAAMITQVDKAWETPVRRADLGPAAVIEQPMLTTRGTQSINRKLDEIIIPRINFTDAKISEAVEYLRDRSAALDTDAGSDAERGVNIVLKLDQAASSQTVTIDLANLPLREALAYITNLANLKFKVEPYAVLIVPLNEPTDTLVTKEYRVPPGFITSAPTGAGNSEPAPFGATAVRSTAKDFLESQGVQFPPGASANFLASSSRLIVRNTQENLDLVDAMVESSSGAAPSQVEIESKFVEISQNNLKELGFDWLLGQFSFGNSGIFGAGGSYGNQFNPGASAYPFLNPNGVPTGSFGPNGELGAVTAGNRSGGTAITANALDAVLLSTAGLGSPIAPAAGILSLAGVFTNPQFQVVLRALNQKKGIDVLSAPKVTTKSGSSATVEVVREFRYPAEYSPPEIPQSTGSGTQPITPATPTSFTMKPTGVRLEVEPTVGSDNYTIDLRLVPEVTEFEGFINYGSPIRNRGIVVTENVINYPVFSERKVETSVSIYDGQTVVLGGLMREDVQKVNDKTPLLGDIPMAGALFRSQSDQHIKRNLVIFVTANLMDPAGQPMANQDVAGDTEFNDLPIDTTAAALEPPLPQ